MRECKITAIEPNGWLRQVLLAQKNGMPGHLDEIGYPYNEYCWSFASLLEGGYSKWWPYEQTAYWIDSMVRLGAVLHDDNVLNHVLPQINASLAHAEDGFIGPDELKETGKCNQWPHAVYFRALTALADCTGNDKYLKAVAKHYRSAASDYTMSREVVNTESMLRVADCLGDKELKQQAIEAYRTFNKNNSDNDSSAPMLLSGKSPYQHGVTFNEQAKLGAVFAVFGDTDEYLDAAVNGYEKLMRFHMLPDGVHSSCEFTLGNDSLKAHETCDIADFTWSLGYMLMATGDGKYADMAERAVFNAAFGAVGPDFKTIQYFCSPNLVLAARNSTHIESFGDTPRFAYQPHHYPECCVGNVGRIFPNYSARMYMQDDNGIYFIFYGDSSFKSGNLRLTQTGGYPFGGEIKVTVSCPAPTETTLFFRVPGWCGNFELFCNGQKMETNIKKQFASLKRVFENGDIITLRVPMTLTCKDSADGGFYFDYGPFLLALEIEEKWEIDTEEKRQTKEFPAYRVTPASEWSYAFSDEKDEVLKNAEIKKQPLGEKGWWGDPPIEIYLNARKLLNWNTEKKEIVKSEDAEEKLDLKMVKLGATKIDKTLELTPPLPDSDFINQNLGEETRIRLVPFGFTNLRISVFPHYSDKGE